MILKTLCVLLVIPLLVLSLAGCAAKPLTMTILSPTDGKTYTTPTIDVRVAVSDAKASAWLNGVQQEVKKPNRGVPYFATKVDLVEGENTIVAMAAKGYKAGVWKEVVEGSVIVTYTPK